MYVDFLRSWDSQWPWGTGVWGCAGNLAHTQHLTHRYLALLIKTREQSVPRAENANRPALKGSPSNMAEMAVRRLEENAVRRNRLELVEPVVAVFCR